MVRGRRHTRHLGAADQVGRLPVGESTVEPDGRGEPQLGEQAFGGTAGAGGADDVQLGGELVRQRGDGAQQLLQALDRSPLGLRNIVRNTPAVTRRSMVGRARKSTSVSSASISRAARNESPPHEKKSSSRPRPVVRPSPRSG
jgi:hypothetical protein